MSDINSPCFFPFSLYNSVLLLTALRDLAVIESVKDLPGANQTVVKQRTERADHMIASLFVADGVAAIA